MITVPSVHPKRLSGTQRLSLFFAVAYLAQGMSCAQFGVLAQPIQFFMMKGLGLNAAAVAFYMSLMMIPWIAKPLYGFVCDFIPLFGYRRKSYLIAANAVAAGGFAIMVWSNWLPLVMAALFCTAITMAMATALTVGLAVEQGRIDGNARQYFCIQEVCYYAANMVAALLGGLLCNLMLPTLALHFAAAIALLPLLFVSILTTFMLTETKSELNLAMLKETGNSLLLAFRSPVLWTAAAFSLCWNFIPSIGTPLYFFESNSLHFAQASIGQLAAWNAAGMLGAALLYQPLTKAMSMTTQLLFAAVLLVASTFAYLGLVNFHSAVFIEIFRGAANMVAILSIYMLAAGSCPKGTEVSVMAILVALRNVATSAATFAGGNLFTYAFHNQFQPLVLCAIAAPALSLLLLALLPKQQPQTAPATLH